eukprot:161347-Chlamydomonas_euryale.AAC.2
MTHSHVLVHDTFFRTWSSMTHYLRGVGKDGLANGFVSSRGGRGCCLGWCGSGNCTWIGEWICPKKRGKGLLLRLVWLWESHMDWRMDLSQEEGEGAVA